MQSLVRWPCWPRRAARSGRSRRRYPTARQPRQESQLPDTHIPGNDTNRPTRTENQFRRTTALGQSHAVEPEVNGSNLGHDLDRLRSKSRTRRLRRPVKAETSFSKVERRCPQTCRRCRRLS